MINIAILGFGTVGSGVAEVCEMNRESIKKKSGNEIHIKKILDIRDFTGNPLESRFTKNADDVFLDPEIAVVVETIGGIGIAYEFTKRALEAGKSVVTSNKELVATHGPELLKLAYSKKLSYLFEASVGGGIPIIRPLNKCLSANQVESIYGVLNGTTNYILTKMKKDRISFEKALIEAQERGYAEQNPTADIEGHDTCRKIAILSSVATGEFIDYHKIYTEGISKVSDRDIAYADSMNCKVKLIAMAKKDTDSIIELRVAPAFITNENPLAIADDVFNAVLVEGNVLGPAMFYGKGAGKLATASAVLADVIEAVLHIHLTPHKVYWEETGSIQVKKHEDCLVKAFIRFKDEEESRIILDELETKTDIKILHKKFDGEFAILVGEKMPLTEGELSFALNSSQSLEKSSQPQSELPPSSLPRCCLSMIRIL